MDKANLISIITPAYNAGKYISQTIDSVLAQTYENWEMVIVDDGSTDNTAAVIKEYCIKDPRIRYLFQENGRQGKARNYAIANSNGTYLAFLDADDLWVKDKLERQLTLLNENIKIDVLYSCGWAINESGEVQKEFNIRGGFYESKDFLQLLLKKNQIPILSVFLKRESVIKVGGFNEERDIQNAEDYHLWLNLANHNFNFYGMSEKLFYYRVHPDQNTHADLYSTVQVIKAISQINFNAVSSQEVQKSVYFILNRSVLYQADRLPNNSFNNLIKLYKDVLKNYSLFFILKISLLLGRPFFKKIAYRCLKMQPN